MVNEDSCNLNCSYCLTGQSTLKESHQLQLIYRPPQRGTYGPASPLASRLDTVVDRIDEAFCPLLLKVTGGEIFLVKGIMDFLEREAQKYCVVVVQTNGLLVKDSDLERFASWGNVVMQVSLDSSSHAGNSYRAPTEELHVRTLRRVEAIVASGLATEIYAVLNNRSIETLEEFALWTVDRRAPELSLFPFPVRGPSAQQYKARPDQLPLLERFVGRYDDFASVLPPRPYFDRLLSFYREGGRTFRCHLPRLVVSTFGDGVVTPCPNIWFTDMGSLLGAKWRDVVGDVGRTGLYRMLLAASPRLDACKGCFTPWDTLSMYLDGQLSLDELCRSPVYAPPPIRRLLAELREEWAREC